MALGSTQLHGSDGLKQLKRLKLSQDRCQGKGRSLPRTIACLAPKVSSDL